MAKIFHIENQEELLIKENGDEAITVVLHAPAVNIRYELSDGVYRILIFNDSKTDVKINDSGFIRNAHCSISYLELNDSNYEQKTNIEVYRGSTLSVVSTYLSVKEKRIDYHLINKEKDSEVSITNNVVALNDSYFKMDLIGVIEKGAKRSKLYQKSHCLTAEKPRRAEVLPVLLIDENDVEASHSLSSGTIDEEVLFYMNSRGLTKSESLNLLLRSYLIPSDDYFKDYLQGSEIQESALKKVEDVCSM